MKSIPWFYGFKLFLRQHLKKVYNICKHYNLILLISKNILKIRGSIIMRIFIDNILLQKNFKIHSPFQK